MDGSTVINLETFLRKNHPGVYQIYNTWRVGQLKKEEANRFSVVSGIYFISASSEFWSVRAKKLTELIKEHGL